MALPTRRPGGSWSSIRGSLHVGAALLDPRYVPRLVHASATVEPWGARGFAMYLEGQAFEFGVGTLRFIDPSPVILTRIVLGSDKHTGGSLQSPVAKIRGPS